nr:TonB-dependent receptor [Chitinophagaceae bacterium]
MKKFAGSIFFFCIFNCSFSQQDTVFNKTLDEVVITATRTNQQLGNIAVPATVISKEQIVQAGSVRLTDVLQEQTGLYITSGGGTSQMGGGLFGSGVQMQGLSPDYTLLLLNGEPLIGRNGGIIDLSRLAVGNIKKIEIVKGPSSSLYGSEAMGGVINIITEKPKQNTLSTNIRYARFNQLDANLHTSFRKRNWGIGFFGNANRSDGYDYDKNTPGKTVDPWRSYTTQITSFFTPTARTKINFTGKYYNEIQHNYFPVPGDTTNIAGNGKVKDLSVAPLITHQFSRNIKSTLRLVFNRYEFSQRLQEENTKHLYYADFFQQDYYKAENQTDFKIGKQHTLIAGLGFIAQQLNTTRYDGIKHSNIVYGFVQDEWKVTNQLLLTGGLRYDGNSDYASAWSPKLAAHYKINKKINVRISYGAGFKAPDFRQLYLNFTNMAAGGYTIYGGNEVTISLLEEQKQNGTITEILPIAYRLATLKPETSQGFNAGMDVAISNKINISANLFRNDINNLIMVDVVAHKANGTEVYSYFNVKKAFTEGIELQSRFIINKNWQ